MDADRIRQAQVVRCKEECGACFLSDWDFFRVPDKHSTGGLPECVLDQGEGPDYFGEECICDGR